MKKPSRFGNAAMIAIVAMLVLYVITAIIGYWAFGINTLDNVLNNLRKDPATIVIRSALTAHVLFAYAVYAQPIFEMTDPLVRKCYLKLTGLGEAKPSQKSLETDTTINGTEKSKSEMVLTESIVSNLPHENHPEIVNGARRNGCLKCFGYLPVFGYIIIIRTLYVFMTIGLAIVIPNFGALMSLIGAATIAAVIFMMPAGFYMKIFWDRISLFEKIACFFIVILGTAAAIIGSIFAIMAMA
jgi:amino acid permease